MLLFSNFNGGFYDLFRILLMYKILFKLPIKRCTKISEILIINGLVLKTFLCVSGTLHCCPSVYECFEKAFPMPIDEIRRNACSVEELCSLSLCEKSLIALSSTQKDISFSTCDGRAELNGRING